VPQGRYERDRLPFSIRDVPDQIDASRTATIEPHHIGSDRSLIDKDQPGGIKQALLSNPAPARLGDVCAMLFRRPQNLFFKVMSCRWKNRESALLLVRMPRLSSSPTVSSKVRSGCSDTRANMSSAHRSKGETLPPRGFAAQLPVLSQRCTHLTAELTLISKRSAASCREAPASTASTTRSRKSPE
jgi:hypothetical protein